MTDEDLDRYYRHQDTGQHGEDDGFPVPIPGWVIGAIVRAVAAVAFVGYVAWRAWP